MTSFKILPISIIVLTKNEEKDLPGCLDTLSWSDDIHVFDSYSTDKTLEIAERYGAKVTQRRFDNWSAHQNWGLRNLPFKYPWVYYSDADERVTPELVEKLRQALEQPGNAVAFRFRRRDYFFGQWLQHVAATPFYIRLFRPEFVHYERLINPVTVVNGEVKQLDSYFHHYPFSKGIAHWLERHNSYSTLEAQQILANRQKQSPFSLIKAFTAKDMTERRYHQKELYYRLPARPLVMFLMLYIGKLGFLDGRAGLTYAILRAIYEYMIVLKVREYDQAP
jgi:glycosyltransferase involved in cell wall biosynthesis